MSATVEALERELGGPLPPEIAQLPVEALFHLLTSFRRAHAHETEQLEQSTAESVRNLPFLLRGPARAIIGI